ELREALNVTIEGPHREDLFLLESLPESGAKFGIMDLRVVTPDRWLAEGDQVRIAGLEFSVVEAPGHTPGSVVFFNQPNRFALMGDVLFQGSVGRTDLPRGDHETLLRSIRGKILPLGDDVAFLPGHGPASSIGEERRNNPFLQG
ncbi:MAG: MBL fold metallo-hydrolase, partial [Terriglobales bacterium]